jgi:hypothetical protein
MTMNSIKTAVKCAILALTTVAGTARAQSCPTMTTLVGSSPAVNDYFGSGVSMSFGGPNNRPLLAIGKPDEDSPAGINSGGWSVWELGTNGAWSLLHDAWNATGEAGERAGRSISISDPYMIVGAPEYQSRGRVRIMRRPTGSNSWIIEDDINPGMGGGTFDSMFGNNVAISAFGGGWAIVGAPLHSWTYESSGAVYVLVRNSVTGDWLNSFTMSGADYYGQVDGRRGGSVAISQSSPWGAFGASDETHDPAFPDNGIAYVIGRTSLTPSVVLPPVNEADQNFGNAVAIEGNWLMVGAYAEDATSAESGLPNNTTDSGAVYVYELSGNAWIYRSTLRAPVPTLSGRFGQTIALSDSQCVITEWFGRRSHVYRRVGGVWSHQSTFRNPESSSDAGFGTALAIRDGRIAIGDLYNDQNGISDAGVVYTATVAPTYASGDLCSDPLPMPSGDYIGCTQNTNPSVGTVTTCGLGAGGQGNDVWFRFTPACNGNAIIDTFGSDFDTVLSVHSACPGASGGNSIVCNDDAGFSAPNNRISLVTFNFTGGQTYLIRVSGYNGANGTYTLRSLLSYGVNNDECATAPTVGLGSLNFNTCAATNSSNPSVALGSVRDVWYRYVAPSAGWYSFDTCGSSFDTVVTLFNGTQQACPSSANALLAQNNDTLGFCLPTQWAEQSRAKVQLSQGQSVMIRVGGFASNDFGPGTLTIAQTTRCNDVDFNNDGSLFDPTDIDAFLSVFSEGPCIPASNICDPIDFNNDGSLFDPQDVDAFLSVFSEGPCF